MSPSTGRHGGPTSFTNTFWGYKNLSDYTRLSPRLHTMVIASTRDLTQAGVSLPQLSAPQVSARLNGDLTYFVLAFFVAACSLPCTDWPPKFHAPFVPAFPVTEKIVLTSLLSQIVPIVFGHILPGSESRSSPRYSPACRRQGKTPRGEAKTIYSACALQGTARTRALRR